MVKARVEARVKFKDRIEFAVQPVDLLLSLIWSIFVRFSKFFFLLKACENCHLSQPEGRGKRGRRALICEFTRWYN